MKDCLMYEKIFEIIDSGNLDLHALTLPSSIKAPINYIDRRKKDLVNKIIIKYGFANFLMKLSDLEIKLDNIMKKTVSQSAYFKFGIYLTMVKSLYELIAKYYMPEIYAKTLIWLTADKVKPEDIYKSIISPMYSLNDILGLSALPKETEFVQESLYENPKRDYKSKLGDLYKTIKLREKAKDECFTICAKMLTIEEIKARTFELLGILETLPKSPEIIIFAKLFIQVIDELSKYLRNLEIPKEEDFYQLSLLKS